MSHEVQKVAERRMKNWVTGQRMQDNARSETDVENVYPYIALSREYGAGGSEIARLVGEKLGWDVLDKELLERMAEEHDLKSDRLDAVDEKKVTWMSEILTSWLEGYGYSQSSYVHCLAKTMMVAAHNGSCVFVGRGARFVLPRKMGLSVHIVAPFDYRVREIALEQNITKDEAVKILRKGDVNSDSYVQEHFHHQVSDPHMYDLVINVDQLTKADAAELIVRAATIG